MSNIHFIILYWHISELCIQNMKSKTLCITKQLISSHMLMVSFDLEHQCKMEKYEDMGE